MEDRRGEFVDRINAAHERWRELVADVGEERMELSGAMGDWTFKDVASHLTAWRRRTIDRVNAAAHGDPFPPAPWPVELGEDEDDPINAWIHEQTKDRRLTDVLAEADAAYDDLVAAVQALPLDDAMDPARFRFLGGGALLDSDPGGHLALHEADVRRWLESLED
jgi:Mycothiol maleylpyruvate isomerase N-terminal domain